MEKEFVSIINDAVVKYNYGDRSKLIREAVAEKLTSLGMKLPKAVTATPPRIGKGGRPPIEKRASEKKQP